jgi:hypothetical protein
VREIGLYFAKEEEAAAAAAALVEFDEDCGVDGRDERAAEAKYRADFIVPVLLFRACQCSILSAKEAWKLHVVGRVHRPPRCQSIDRDVAYPRLMSELSLSLSFPLDSSNTKPT